MGRKVLIIDTSIFCIYLKVPGKETCGADDDRWDFARVDEKIEQEKANGANFILPIATIIETGNHIAQASGQRFEIAKSFCDMIIAAIEGKSPWLPLGIQTNILWSTDQLAKLAKTWPSQAESGHSMGDATIADIAKYYHEQGIPQVEIFTGDEGLKAYQPVRDDNDEYLRRN